VKKKGKKGKEREKKGKRKGKKGEKGGKKGKKGEKREKQDEKRQNGMKTNKKYITTSIFRVGRCEAAHKSENGDFCQKITRNEQTLFFLKKTR